MSKPITLEHLDDPTAEWIGEQAARRGVDEETVVLHLIHRGIDVEQREAQRAVHHDLDSLAGTWSEEEADEFERATAAFRRVDEDLWR